MSSAGSCTGSIVVCNAYIRIHTHKIRETRIWDSRHEVINP